MHRDKEMLTFKLCTYTIFKLLSLKPYILPIMSVSVGLQSVLLFFFSQFFSLNETRILVTTCTVATGHKSL
jgi:exosortase/archaeosortase